METTGQQELQDLAVSRVFGVDLGDVGVWSGEELLFAGFYDGRSRQPRKQLPLFGPLAGCDHSAAERNDGQGGLRRSPRRDSPNWRRNRAPSSQSMAFWQSSSRSRSPRAPLMTSLTGSEEGCA